MEGDLRRRDTTARRLELAVDIGVTVFRVAGLAAIALVADHGAAARPETPDETAIFLGVVGIAAFLWLVLSGCFGYGSARRSDWVALIPFCVALVVREAFTVHSIQELEIQFVQGPVDKHSVVYPLLQMFFVPLVRDPQAFMMHINGVLGALACLPMYLFVRRRLESRAAGFLCALFLATNPLVARFSPTDGPYALLLAAWFAGLALLSAREINAGSIFGGGVLLGVAATVRIEGFVLLLASFLMLDLRMVMDGVRRHRIVAVSTLLAIAALVAVQIYFVLRYNRGNFPPMTFDSVTWLLAYNGRIFAALVVIGAGAGIVTRRWLGLFALIAMLVVIAPVGHSMHVAALHRLVPACALQAMIAGIGAYSLMVWAPRTGAWGWLATVPGTLVAFSLLAQHWNDLTRPYVFTEEYDLVRGHLAPGGVPPQHCTLIAFKPESDIDIHDFGQVVPGMRVLDCATSGCLAELSVGGCFYYVRSVTCYFHPAGVPPACAVAGITERGDHLGCMNERSASFERSVELEPVEVRTIDIWNTFAEASRNYPQRAEIGLFRVRPKPVAQHQSRS